MLDTLLRRDSDEPLEQVQVDVLAELLALQSDVVGEAVWCRRGWLKIFKPASGTEAVSCPKASMGNDEGCQRRPVAACSGWASIKGLEIEGAREKATGGGIGEIRDKEKGPFWGQSWCQGASESW